MYGGELMSFLCDDAGVIELLMEGIANGVLLDTGYHP